MSIELPEAHARGLDGVHTIVGGVSQPAWDQAGACEAWSVRAAQPHRERQLVGGATGRRSDHRPRWATATTAMCWAMTRSAVYDARPPPPRRRSSRPDAMTTPVAVSYGPVPGEIYCGHRFIDVLVHGWDLAASTGQSTELDPDLVNDGHRRDRTPDRPLERQRHVRVARGHGGRRIAPGASAGDVGPPALISLRPGCTESGERHARLVPLGSAARMAPWCAGKPGRRRPSERADDDHHRPPRRPHRGGRHTPRTTAQLADRVAPHHAVARPDPARRPRRPSLFLGHLPARPGGRRGACRCRRGSTRGGADAARQILIAIAAAVITVVGVVFSITIVALTLASTQFGPRMLRNFIRDRGTQITLGMFVATFVYAVLALGSVSARRPRRLRPPPVDHGGPRRSCWSTSASSSTSSTTSPSRSSCRGDRRHRRRPVARRSTWRVAADDRAPRSRPASAGPTGDELLDA